MKNLRKNLLVLLFLAFFSTLFFVGVDFSSAQGTDTFGVEAVDSEIVLGNRDIRVVVAKIINAVLILLGIVAVVIVLYGGFVYMTSGGQEEKISQGKKILINGAIGLVIILSAFAIVQFVLSGLQKATGLNQEGSGSGAIGGGPSSRCSDPIFFNNNPVLCGENQSELSCADRNFVVKSITPSVVSLGMNNIAIRAVFSRPLSASTTLSTVLSLVNGQNRIPLRARFVDNKRMVVEAVRDGQDFCYDPGDPEKRETCLLSGQFTVEVNQNLFDENNQSLSENVSCGSFARRVDFGVNQEGPILDRRSPDISEFKIDGKTGDRIVIKRGNRYTINFKAQDDSGIGYVRLRVYPEGSDPNTGVLVYDGPAVSTGSAGQFNFSQRFVLPTNAVPRKKYAVEASVYDVDHNVGSGVINFVVVGSNCDSDGRPLSESGDNECLGSGGDSCSENWQCASQLCDRTSGLCVDYPLISGVDPWDAGEGSLVTIFGSGFGNRQGVVEFGRDTNGDNAIDENDTWVRALPAECGNSSWRDRQVVVQVPADSSLPVGSKSAIRIKISLNNNQTFTESTIDSRGDVGGPNRGLFEKTGVRRPGICSVLTTETGNGFGSGGTAVKISGLNFGTTQGNSAVNFGQATARVSSWSNALVGSRVPESLRSGDVGVAITVGGVRSNQVNFKVLEGSETRVPMVESIDPRQTVAGGLITVRGQRFGDSVGQLRLCPVNNGECVLAELTLPEGCGDVWKENAIIAKIKENTLNGDYKVFVVNDANLVSKEEIILKIASGRIPPAICAIEPSSGPAPLPQESAGLKITGLNLNQNLKFYFWSRGSSMENMSTWLSAGNGPLLRVVDANTVLVKIPVSDQGLSMQTGPIKISALSPDGETFGNSINYTVNDCRETGSVSPGEGYHCCAAGAEAGVWKPASLTCAGETRTAGYVWRFTTGIFPSIPKVIESCDQSSWENEASVMEIPSPSPWRNWPQGDQTCVNSDVAVRFSMDMDADSFSPANVKVYKCTTSGNVPDCTESRRVPVELDSGDISYNARTMMISTGANWDVDAWYQVQLLENIQSEETITILGQETVKRAPLQKSKACGTGTAYCFEFKTSATNCTLRGAGITPLQHTAKKLGDLAFKYVLWGRGSQECTVIGVDGLGWRWSTADDGTASPRARVRLDGDETHEDSLARGTALAHSAPDSVRINAEANIRTGALENFERITTYSNLTIELEDPQVMFFWPNCGAACVNTSFGVRFNRQMSVGTYENNFILRKCADENCNLSGNLGPTLPIYIGENSTQQEMKAYLSAGEVLEPDSWYVAIVKGGDSGVKSVARMEPQEVLGRALANDFVWKFKTKNDSSLCTVAKVEVLPNPYIASHVGARAGYSALPFGSPDECSPTGQELSPWDYGWAWRSQNTQVASLTSFSFQGRINPACGFSCLPTGSDIPSGTLDTDKRLCGNGILEDGEDCDIAITGERAGVTCGFNCLRPGSRAENCGNGARETQLGEDCDPEVDEGCTDQCQWAGSNQQEPGGDLNVSWCGSGSITAGEECDIADPETSTGCSTRCLHIGTPLAQSWCDSQDNISQAAYNACLSAKSLCGNNILEEGEECESVNNSEIKVFGVAGLINMGDSASVCTNRCLLKNICGKESIPASGPNRVRCVAGNEGCEDDCTLSGSNIGYSESSVCGDAVVGIGENAKCESQPAPSGSSAANPMQIATAVGAGQTDESGKQSTLIEAVAVKKKVGASMEDLPANGRARGSGDFILQCGFSEYSEPAAGAYNSCPENTDNSFGVGGNTCCFERPTRIDEYPLSGAGFETFPVCRNTLISFTLNGEIDESSLRNNILIAEGYNDAAYDCAASGQRDVTSLVNSAKVLAQNQENVWWKKWLVGLKNWWISLWSEESLAAGGHLGDNMDLYDTSVKKWCAGKIQVTPKIIYEKNESGAVISSTINLELLKMLEGEKTYAVMVIGEGEGVKDRRGVGIKNKYGNQRNDLWQFKTGTDVCKLSSVQITPRNFIFTSPGQSDSFVAEAVTEIGQRIASVAGVYAWEWSWGPGENEIFEIPAGGGEANTAEISIAARNVSGVLSATANAKVVADTTAGNNQSGRTFVGVTDLVADFCENIWPAREANEWTPFNDNVYNFSFHYCADFREAKNVSDDLPYIRMVEADSRLEQNEEVLRKYLFFNEQNDDVIGVQIFKNTTRATAAEWYSARFQNRQEMRSVSISGYDALTDGNNYYVNALNQPNVVGEGRMAYSNIYLFSINENASTETKAVFEKILNSLRFNTNMTDFRYCGTAGSVDHEANETCVTDFECLDINGNDLTCLADKTKMLRDWQRLRDLKRAQTMLENYRVNRNKYPELKAGSFVPGYTVSKWSSWGNFGGELPGMPLDPINRWDKCAREGENVDPATCWAANSSKYVCPRYSSVYEYESKNNGLDYTLRANLEYFDQSSPVVGEFLQTEHFSDEPWCAPEEIISPAGGVCGDEVVGPGEECDPPGRISYSQRGYLNQTVGSCQNAPLGQCGRNSDCVATVLKEVKSYSDTTQGTEEYFVAGKPDNRACAFNKNIMLYHSISSAKVMKVFTCGSDNDCRDPQNFLGETKANALVLGRPTLLIRENLNNFFCVPMSNTANYSAGRAGICSVNNGQTFGDCGNLVATQTCSATCRVEYGSCLNNSVCGDGRLDGNEACDDGQLNGTYNHCNNSCDGLSAQYCGNNNVETEAGEKCDPYDPDLHGQDKPSYRLNKEESCSWDCRGFGPYCGDGVTQRSNNESCDDGNRVSGDGCNASCKKENLACRQADPHIETSLLPNPRTQIYISREKNGDYSLFDNTAKKFVGIPIAACSTNTSGNEICLGFGLECLRVEEDTDNGLAVYMGKLASDRFSCPSGLPNSPCVGGCFNNINLTSDDKTGIRVTCSGVYSTADLPEEPEVVPVGCGNSRVDAGEECDLGQSNGVACQPAYNQSCSYCSRTCRTVRVDSLARCGNGILEANEACEVKDGKVINADAPDGLVCADLGNYECSANCQEEINNCVFCGSKTTNNTHPMKYPAFASLHLVNPMIGNTKSENSPGLYYPTVLSNINSALVRNNPPEIFTTPQQGISDLNYLLGAFDIRTIAAPFYNALSGNNSRRMILLESDRVCDGKYSLFFNQKESEDRGDLFPYHVDNNQQQVTNEFVYSPAVPDKTFRVVVRWTSQEKNAGAMFFGNAYSQSLASEQNFTGVVSGASATKCDFGYRENNYFIPSPRCESYYATSTFVHPFGNTPNVYVQSFTINTEKIRAGKRSPIAFFVGSMGESSERPISEFVNSRVSVEVYEFHSGQDPEYSIYLPTQTFNIGEAEKSTNTGARYWHAFNLEYVPLYRKYMIKPVQKIETDFCGVQNNMPDSAPCVE